VAKIRPSSGWPNKKPRAGRNYDVEMIRDFLDHLMWELRIIHFENTNPSGADHGELMSQIQKYQQEYRGSKALMAIMTMATEGYSLADVERARRNFRRVRAVQMEEAIQHLEELAPIFEEALACAAMSSSDSPDQLPAKRVDAGLLLGDLDDEDKNA